jgi:methionyl-tRNA formyltransferase
VHPSEVVTLDQPARIRIAFFGTPEYAVPALRALAADPRFVVLLAVTQPDRPAGRGHRLVAPPVKIAATELGVPVIQPATLRDEAVRERLRALDADLFVVAAYGLIFSNAILGIPQFGCLNLHASILPRFRGAAPIPAAILSGDDQTGVTLMVMERGLDTGPILAVARTPITTTDTTESLTARLADIGARLAVDSIPDFLSGRVRPMPQPAGASVVRRLTKADGQIDWRRAAVEVDRHVRAMWPWPRAWTVAENKVMQIHAVTVQAGQQEFAAGLWMTPGSIRITDGKPQILCGDGRFAEIERGQWAGAKPLTGADLVRGRALDENVVLSLVDPAPEPLVLSVAE